MPGSYSPIDTLPSPGSLLVRLALVALVLVGFAQTFAREILEPMLPALRGAVSALDSDLHVLDVDIATDGQNKTIRVRAVFTIDAAVSGQWTLLREPDPRGWTQIEVTLRSVLQHALLLLIFALAWPARSIREGVLRLGISLLMAALLVLVDTPFTILAEIWNPVRQDMGIRGFWPLIAWSRFLMGGGGLALAAGLAVCAIAAAARLSRAANGRRIGRG